MARVEAVDLVALLGVDLCRLVEGAALLLGRLGQDRDLAVALEQQLLGFRQPVLDLGQAVHDGVLEHAASILVFVERRLELADFAFEAADQGVAAIDLDRLPGGIQRGVLELALELVQLDRILGADAVLVGADLGFRQRHRPLDILGGQPHRALAVGGRDQQRNQRRHQEAQRHQHDREDVDHWRDPRVK